jgi:2-alkenal reductase
VINRQTGGLGSFGSGDADTVPAGVGTGFIIDDDGHLVTNWHVVEGGDEFVVLLASGEERDAELIGSDRLSDLAVLDMEGDVPATVPFGDSDALHPGQTVIAIGSPLGEFTTTVTQGIVSALNRDFGQFGGDPRLYNNLIQHDAAINPGNSGGPLFTLAGEVVGVNTIGITETGGPATAQGLFFAVPSNTVQEVVSEILENGEVQYPFFGITSAPVTAEIASEFDLPVDYGNIVIEVEPGTGAEDAGIEPNDIILEIDGQRIDQENPFVEILFDHEPGDTVEVLIQRGDEQLTVEVTLTELDERNR